MSHRGLMGSSLVAAAALAGCRGFGPAPTPDSLATWSSRPLPPDPGLTAVAIGEHAACRLDPDMSDAVVPAVPQVLVQDRRTENIAAFLVQNADHFGGCMVSRSGESGGGFGGPLEPMVTELSIDDRSSGTIGDGSAMQLGGRVRLPGAGIIVRLDDGRDVVASVAAGFWLAWWPAGANATEVLAVGADGGQLTRLEVPFP